MKFLFFAFCLILGNQLFAQSTLDEKLTELATKNDLYGKKLDKLESIRIDPALSERERKSNWEKAFIHWDNYKVTDSFCFDALFMNVKLSRGNCNNVRYRNTLYGVKGYSLGYLLALTDSCRADGTLSPTNEKVLKNILTSEIKNESIIEDDIKAISTAYSNYLEKTPITSAQLDQIIQFVNQLTGGEEIQNTVVGIVNLGDKEFSKLTDFLKGLGLGFNDVMYTLYDSSKSALQIGDKNKKYNFYFGSYSDKHVSLKGQLRTSLAGDFGSLTYYEGNISEFNKLDFLKYTSFFEDKTISNVVLLKLLFETWEEFELRAFRTSKTTSYLETKGLVNDVNLMLSTIEDRFPKYYFWTEFDMRSKSPIELLFIAAYNDIYTGLGLDKMATHLREEIDVMSFDLTDEQRKIIAALLNPNEKETQIGLQKYLLNRSFKEFETEHSFRLACFVAFDQKSAKVNRDWNHAQVYIDPFVTEKVDLSVPTQTLSKEELEECKEIINQLIQTVDYTGSTYIYSSIRGRYEVSPKLSSALAYTISLKIEAIMPMDTYSSYVRIVTKTAPVDRENTPKAGNELKQMPPAPAMGTRVVFFEENESLSSKPVIEAEIIDFPDVDAEFPGGNHLLKGWIKENLVYPEISRELGDQGRVYVTFIVEADGSISTIDVMNGGVTDELNREAKRLIRTMPRWSPGKVKGKNIRTKCRVPVTFTL